jgi:hypothetical protein
LCMMSSAAIFVLVKSSSLNLMPLAESHFFSCAHLAHLGVVYIVIVQDPPIEGISAPLPNKQH